MQPVFQILPVDLLPAQTNLFIEVSESSLAYFFQSINDKRILGVSVFNGVTNNGNPSRHPLLQTIDQDEWLKGAFNKILISYSFPESVLTPSKIYNEVQGPQDLQLIYGSLAVQTVLTDHLTTENIYNVYSIAASLHSELLARFPDAKFCHQYSLLTRQDDVAKADLLVIFYQNKIVVRLQNNGQLKLVQSYAYVTADDVLYHMLNVCKQFHIHDAHVQLCGMIDRTSQLCKRIENYFSKAEYPGPPKQFDYVKEIGDLPGHFFTHLFLMAACEL